MSLLEKYKIKPNEIQSIKIYLDDNVPEDMNGIIRIGDVEVKVNNKKISIQDLVENDQFFHEKDIRDYVNENLESNIAKIVTYNEGEN